MPGLGSLLAGIASEDKLSTTNKAKQRSFPQWASTQVQKLAFVGRPLSRHSSPPQGYTNNVAAAAEQA